MFRHRLVSACLLMSAAACGTEAGKDATPPATATSLATAGEPSPGCYVDGTGTHCEIVDIGPGQQYSEDVEDRITFGRKDGSRAIWLRTAAAEQRGCAASPDDRCYIICSTPLNLGKLGTGKVGVGLVSVSGCYDSTKTCQPAGWNTHGRISDGRLDDLCARAFVDEGAREANISGSGDTFFSLLHTERVKRFEIPYMF